MISNSALFNSFQKEFCPPLDSSLLTALLGDLTTDPAGKPVAPTTVQINELRSNLKELAAQAEEVQLSEFADLTEDGESTPGFYHGHTATSSSFDSDSSGSSLRPFSTPLGFLQAVLPHIPTARLGVLLENAEKGEELDDMWEVVSSILSQEAIRELEERGLKGLDADDNLGKSPIDNSTTWETVTRKQSGKAKGKNRRPTKLTLVDVRQQQHARPKPSGKVVATGAPAPDLWTQVSSLSTRLQELLPTYPASFFQSYFHTPAYPTPYDALCSALNAICDEHVAPHDDYVDVQIRLFDVLMPEYDSEEHPRLISDVVLSVRATQGRGDDAFDLAKLLRTLGSDTTSGFFEMGVYHLPASLSSPTQEKSSTARLPAGPPPIPPPSPFIAKRKPPPSPSEPKVDPYQWQTVPQRKPRNDGPSPLAQYIPAYTRDVNGIKVRGSGNGYGKGGKGDVGELKEYRRQVGESIRKRNEMLREASKMWQRGNAKSRGGEVAFYFAEKAREFQDLARLQSLNAARTMVQSKRLASKDHDTLDLHGTTVAEALVIVKETLQSQGSSQSKPLKIVTGRGAHSANQVSVLKPSIKKALVNEGWDVGTWEGGLVVRGHRG